MDNLSLLLQLVSLILFILFLLQKWLLPNPGSQTPPSPPKLPIFGHLLSLGTHPHITLQTYSLKYGPLFLLHLGSNPTLIISSPQTAREITKTHDLAFANRPKSTMNDKLLYNSRDIAASPYGEYWRQLKSIAVLHLLSTKRVQSFRAIREEEVELMVESIRDRGRDGAPVNLTEVVSGFTSDFVCRVALGRKYGRGFREVLLEFGELLGSFCVGDFVPWLGWVHWVCGLENRANRVAKELDVLIEEVIQDHGDGNNNVHECRDFVDILLMIQKENSLGFPVQMESIKALILDMFAAGTDTTYTVIEWTMSELLKHPQIMKRLQTEIKETVQNRTYVKEDDLEQMHYLKAIIKETLRLHPPIPLLIPRESTEYIKLNGYDIKPGTRVIINAWAIGRDPESWSEPDEFKPERFMNSSIDFKGQNFELIPFGAGRRGCPGIMFANIVNELALANLVHSLEWELPNGVNAKDLDMSEAVGLTIHRKFPLVVVATPC